MRLRSVLLRFFGGGLLGFGLTFAYAYYLAMKSPADVSWLAILLPSCLIGWITSILAFFVQVGKKKK